MKTEEIFQKKKVEKPLKLKSSEMAILKNVSRLVCLI